MTTVHRTVLETTPDEAFVRLTALLAGADRSGGPWDVGRTVHLPLVEPAGCRVAAVERPNVMVLERDGEVRHSIVVAPVVGGGAEVVWTTTCSVAGDPVAAAVGGAVLRDLTLADPADRSPRPEALARPVMAPAVGSDRVTVLDHVVLDHSYLATQLDRVCAADAPPSVPVVTALLADIGRHEAAESALLRPRLRSTLGGGPVAASLDAQQRAIARDCHEVIEAALADDPRLLGLLQRLRVAVLDHCSAEEAVEHPRLAGAVSRDVLEDLGRSYVSMTRVEIDLRGEETAAAQRSGQLRG